jgi:hypothetical protein
VSYQDWISEHLRVTGPLETVKERPWSFVVKVPTAEGLFWFKENRGQTGYEAGLIEALARWVPGRVLAPAAVDAARGWSLLPDGGPVLREAGAGDWAAMLASHAQLQLDLGGFSDHMLSLGVPNQAPTAMASWARANNAPALDLPPVSVPLSLQHDDLHDGNVFASGKVFDWGDSAVAHPFGVLLVSLRVLADMRGLKPGDPELARARDAYLEPWSAYGTRAELTREAEAVVEFAKLGRAMSWQRAMTSASPAEIAELGDPVQGWLGEIGQPNDW